MGAIESLAGHPLATAIGWGLLHSVWQVSAIALACAVTLRMARRAAADVRYAIACAGLALMLVWPAATAAERLRASGDARGADVQDRAEAATLDFSASLPPQPLGAASSQRLPQPALGIQMVVPYVSLLWAAGVVLFAMRTAGAWYLAQRLRSRCVAAPPEPWDTRFRRLVRRLRVADRVTLLESRLVDVPAVVGWLKPVVLVPASAFAGLPPHQLEAILAHELAHVRRHDHLANLLQVGVETLLFYHPAMWWLSRQARAEREHCCDDLAVALCGDRLEYARALAGLETMRRSAPALSLGADGGSLLKRVSRLLGATASHEQRTPAWLVAGAILAIAIGGAFAAAGVRAERTSDAADPLTTVLENSVGGTRDADTREGSAVPGDTGNQPTPPAPVAPAAPKQASPPAPPTGAGTATTGEGRFSHSSRGVKWDARYKGRIELSDDGRDIVRVSPGGYFKVSEGGWLSSRSIELSGTQGELVRKYYRGLREQPYGDEAREFLAAMLQKLLRSGFAANQRVAQLLKRGGPSAVLNAIGDLESDYARRVYYTQLFKQATLDPPTLARALTDAGRQMSSDYETAELLIAAAPQSLNDREARRAFLHAASTIDSDYELRRVLSTALETAALDGAGLKDLLRIAASINSDYEAAELLISAVRIRPLDATSREAFFENASAIESDYEHRRVLSAVMRERALDVETRRSLLRSAAALGSDYERAEFMLDWLRAGDFEASAREFLAASGDIGSGYERARVLGAVLDRPELSPGALVATLRVIATLSGDYEIGQLLLRVAEKHPVTGDVRQAYLAAADRLGDGYQKDQAFAALVRAERRGRN